MTEADWAPFKNFTVDPWPEVRGLLKRHDAGSRIRSRGMRREHNDWDGAMVRLVRADIKAPEVLSWKGVHVSAFRGLVMFSEVACLSGSQGASLGYHITSTCRPTKISVESKLRPDQISAMDSSGASIRDRFVERYREIVTPAQRAA